MKLNSRPVKKLVITLLAVAGVFLVYIWTIGRGGSASRDGPQGSASAGRDPTTGPSLLGIGRGERPWVTQLDSEGQLVSQFRAGKYEPQPDQSIRVTNPEARITLDDGHTVQLTAADGLIYVQDPTEGQGRLMGGAQQVPTRGQLRQVHMTLTPAGASAPSFTLDVNNATFDNDTFRLFTDSFTNEKGEIVPGDHVPVVMRGRDVDFDGRGLTIRWDQQGRRLNLLEIAHGERVTIKNMPQVRERDTPEQPRKIPVETAPTPQSVSASPPPAVVGTLSVPSTTPAPATTEAMTLYRATMTDNIVVTQVGQTLLTASEMQVDFLARQLDMEAEESAQATPPPPKPPTSPAGSASIGGADASPASDAPVGSSSELSTPGTIQEPITVTWTGKLRILPHRGDPIVPLRAGGMAVKVVGAPLTFNYEGSNVTAGSAIVQPQEQSVLLEASDSVASIRITDPEGRTIDAAAIRYDGKRAILRGPGRVIAKLEQDPPESVTLRWSDRCEIDFYEGPEQRRPVARSARIIGEAQIDHPELQLSADLLDFAFGAPDGIVPDEPKLRNVLARGHVQAIAKQKDRDWTIGAGQLIVQLATASATKGTYANRFEASENATVTDGQQKLSAQKIVALLDEPTTDDRAPLKEFHATGSVKLTDKGGAESSADSIAIVNENGDMRARIEGSPARLVSLEGVVTGNVIHGSQREQRLVIEGPGGLRQTMTVEGEPARLIGVEWTGGANVDLLRNRIDIDKGVTVTSPQPDGTTASAKADHLTITLADAPRAATSPTTAKANDNPLGDLFGDGETTDKKPTLLTLTGAPAELSVTDSAWTYRTHVLANRIEYDPVKDQLTIPVPGQALYQDLREQKEESATGTLAMEWKKSLVVDRAGGRGTILGNVRVRHVPAKDGEAGAVDVTADRITADFTPSDKPQLTRVAADGAITFSSKDVQFTAGVIEYDPEIDMVTATGTNGDPPRLRTTDGAAGATFRSLKYRLKDQRLDSIDGVNVNLRP